MFLEVKNLTFAFGQTVLFENLNMSIEAGSFTAILGPSGKGKTTLLRCLAGLEKPVSGSIVLDGNTLTSDEIHVEPHARKVGLLFQDYALFPHMSVADNIGYGVRKEDKAFKKMIVNELLGMMDLKDFHHRKPSQCSGGQQQRIAIARALASQPKVLCLDEPFSNLDLELKERMRGLMKVWFKQKGVTVIMVTHDVDDAKAMADTIVELK